PRAGLVAQVRRKPPLCLFEGCAFARGVVLDLVARETADGEVARARVCEIDAAHRCSRRHRERLRQFEPCAVGAEQLEELPLLGVVGAGGIAERRTDSTEAL